MRARPTSRPFVLGQWGGVAAPPVAVEHEGGGHPHKMADSSLALRPRTSAKPGSQVWPDDVWPDDVMRRRATQTRPARCVARPFNRPPEHETNAGVIPFARWQTDFRAAIIAPMAMLWRPTGGAPAAPDRADWESVRPRTTTYVCDACGRTRPGPPAGSGLFVWTRGEEVRYEEPPLCEECAARVTAAALGLWAGEEED